jgi:phosphate-selective porin OprO and OprP
VNFESQNNFEATTGNDQKWNAVSVDGIYKYKGFSANGMYTFAMRKQEAGADFDADGFFIQAGKLFCRRTLEFAFRYGQFDPTRLTTNNLTRETRVVFNWYYARHGLKWQTDVGQVETQSASATKLFELRSQLQFIF